MEVAILNLWFLNLLSTTSFKLSLFYTSHIDRIHTQTEAHYPRQSYTLHQNQTTRSIATLSPLFLSTMVTQLISSGSATPSTTAASSSLGNADVTTASSQTESNGNVTDGESSKIAAE